MEIGPANRATTAFPAWARPELLPRSMEAVSEEEEDSAAAVVGTLVGAGDKTS